MLTVSFQRRHYYRLAALLFTIIVFHHRLSVGLTLAYTYFAFTFLPTAVLGSDDGWNLEKLIAPYDAPEIVPRIIHQARLGDLEMKDSWRVANESCAALHPAPEWRFELWDTPRANAFVKENYPELLDMYLGYGQEIQRSNVIRYLILYKMGGIYLDLDIKCKVPLDFFTTVDWVSPPGLPAGINNAFMAAAPGHPFLKHAIDNLRGYDLNWVSLYATDMFSAGCHYISTMHATYTKHSTLRVLPKEYKLGSVSVTPIFDHLGAASWHRGDASAIKVIGVAVEWFLIPWKIIALNILVVGACVWICRKRAQRVERIRKEDVELFDVERELLRIGEEDAGEDESTGQNLQFWRNSNSEDSTGLLTPLRDLERTETPLSPDRASEITLHEDESNDETKEFDFKSL